MSTEKFCLRWNDFESNLSVAFKDLRDDKEFFDVTLVCDDSQVQAHKLILSACSPLFRRILLRNPHHQPLLYLRGVKFDDLLSVLNFMYHGEVNVAQEELNSFLSVAEDLCVKGLTQGQKSKEIHRDSKLTSLQKSRSSSFENQKASLKPCENQEDNDEIKEIPNTIKLEASEDREPYEQIKDPLIHNRENYYIKEPQVKTRGGVQSSINPQVTSNYSVVTEANDMINCNPDSLYQENLDGDYNEDYDQYMGEYSNQSVEGSFKGGSQFGEGKEFSCLLCGKSYKSKGSLATHVSLSHGRNESNGQAFVCLLCQKYCNSKNALNIHKSRYHNKNSQDP